MLGLIILICVFSPNYVEMQTLEHLVHISNNSENNTTTENIYNKANGGPNNLTKANENLDPSEKYEEIKMKEYIDNTKKNITDCQDTWKHRSKDKDVHLSPKKNNEYLKAKTKCLQFERNEALALMNTQPTIEIQSEKNPNTFREMLIPYAADKKFIIDNEDVRTDSRNTNNGWPYSYNGPYEYKNKNLDNKDEKAKDKRFFGVHTTITPVSEKAIANMNIENISNAASSSDPVIDNPIYGDQPFFSFVLNDYFDNHHDEDPLIFKDFSLGEEFDNGVSSKENNKRHSRRLQGNNNPSEIQNKNMSLTQTTADKNLVTQKAYDNRRKFDNYQKSDVKNDRLGLNQNRNGRREMAFKDFADSFANKFGLESSNKNSKFMLQTNQDKGQKRKGFKRIYHKDEYQEDNEFYDNINKNAQFEENGGSNFSIGGSHSFLQSNAAGSVGNEANSLKKSQNMNDKIFENLYGVTDRIKERDNEINHYRNIAKDTALSNNADYVDNFRV